MKLFRQKDELFELMGKAAERRQAQAPRAPTTSATSSNSSPTPAAAGTPAGTPTGTPASESPTAKSPRSLERTAKLPPTRKTFPSPTPTSSSASGARPPVTSTGTRRLPKPPAGFGAGPGMGKVSPEDDLFEIDGDALVVVDDGWEEAHPAPPGGTFAIRADTAIVGGLLAGGLLITAFFVGRTTTTPDAPAERPITPVVIQAVPSVPSVPPSSAPSAPTTLPASAPRSTTPNTATPSGVALSMPTRPGAASALVGAFSTSPEQQTPSPQASQPQAAPQAAQSPQKKFDLLVVATTSEKAAAVAQWLNEAPRSPIFGRGDLKAVVSNGGSVRIVGFAQKEADVLSRVKATSDPTNGGSGTFQDAYYASVRN